MHYRNGREARNGDKVVMVSQYGQLAAGILYDATPGNDRCNGRIAPLSPNDAYANLKDVLHIEDAQALFAEKG